MYVLRMEPATNSLIVGTANELGQSELMAQQVTYISGQAPTGEIDVTVKIRYKARETKARLRPWPDAQAQLVLSTSLRDITPGQSVVFFQGEQVLGGGIIESANPL
jgi:tRNA-specific 2-thiouridylase